MKKIVKTYLLLAILALGTPNLTVSAVATQQSIEWNALDVVATAYCPCSKCCGQHSDGVTAIGMDAFSKGVAVDRRLIPLRSRVLIPGYGTVLADDVGGAIKHNRIDVRFSSHAKALNWGVRNLRIYYKTP